MKVLLAMLAAMVAVMGMGAASSLDYTLSAATAGATYTEHGDFQLAPQDSLDMADQLSFSNLNGFADTGSFRLENHAPASSYSNDQVLFDQSLHYDKQIQGGVDPLMANSAYIQGAHGANFQWNAGATPAGVQLGATMVVNDFNYANLHGYTTNAALEPIMDAQLFGWNLWGAMMLKDSFSFDRANQEAIGFANVNYVQ